MFEENNRGLKISVTIDQSNNCLVIVIVYEKKRKISHGAKKSLYSGGEKNCFQTIAEIMNRLLFFVQNILKSKKGPSKLA